MEAAELARWTRFAAKGGIGKCTAICDCVAENPGDPMFLKDDEITVLMQIAEKPGTYVGYCEGVVGRFQGADVKFHAKLKKLVKTKRSSISAGSHSQGKSPTPSNGSHPSSPALLPVDSRRTRVSLDEEVASSIRSFVASPAPLSSSEPTVTLGRRAPSRDRNSRSRLDDLTAVTPDMKDIPLPARSPSPVTKDSTPIFQISSPEPQQPIRLEGTPQPPSSLDAASSLSEPCPASVEGELPSTPSTSFPIPKEVAPLRTSSLKSLTRAAHPRTSLTSSRHESISSAYSQEDESLNGLVDHHELSHPPTIEEVPEPPVNSSDPIPMTPSTAVPDTSVSALFDTSRISTHSDGETGIGLSLLQNLAGAEGFGEWSDSDSDTQLVRRRSSKKANSVRRSKSGRSTRSNRPSLTRQNSTASSGLAYGSDSESDEGLHYDDSETGHDTVHEPAQEILGSTNLALGDDLDIHAQSDRMAALVSELNEQNMTFPPAATPSPNRVQPHPSPTTFVFPSPPSHTPNPSVPLADRERRPSIARSQISIASSRDDASIDDESMMDIYDNYRYSRFSVGGASLAASARRASSASRRQSASSNPPWMSASSRPVPLPPAEHLDTRPRGDSIQSAADSKKSMDLPNPFDAAPSEGSSTERPRFGRSRSNTNVSLGPKAVYITPASGAPTSPLPSPPLPPPMPSAIVLPVSSSQRTENPTGSDSDSSVYTQSSVNNASRPLSDARTLSEKTLTSESTLGAASTMHRPAPLDLSNDTRPADEVRSPLLHTTWTPLSSPPAGATATVSDIRGYTGTGDGFTGGGKRQDTPENASFFSGVGEGSLKTLEEFVSPIPDPGFPTADSFQGTGSKEGESQSKDNPGVEEHAGEMDRVGPPESELATSTKSAARVLLPASSIVSAPSTTPMPPSIEGQMYTTTIDIQRPPPTLAVPGQPMARPPRPSLAELRGAPPGQPEGVRQSLFLPHPNAPKPPSANSPGPMYITQQQPPPSQPQARGSALQTIRMALSSPPRGMNAHRGPTIYGRLTTDLSAAMGPVPIAFSLDPPPATAPPPGPGPLSNSVPPIRVTASPVPRMPSPLVPHQTDERPQSVDTKGVIPRPNFYAKAPGARPRSRSFSGFSSPTVEVLMPLQKSREEGNILAEMPSVADIKQALTPTFHSPSQSSSKPSPLKISSSFARSSGPIASTLKSTLPSSPLSQFTFPREPIGVPPSPTLANRPVALRPGLSRPNPPGSSPPKPGHQVRTVAGDTASVKPTEGRTSLENDRVSVRSSRSNMASSTPHGLGRQSSLRAKLSLPNLRRTTSRQEDLSSPLSDHRLADADTVQVKDMDFELIRPNLAHFQAARSSEDSGVLGREASMDGRSDGKLLRAESPALSVSSPLSPSFPSDSGSVVGLPPPVAGLITESPRPSDSESSLDAHRHREQKWMTIMNAVAASQSRKSKKVKKLLLEGVPSSVRYLVWSHLTDGKSRIVPNVYGQLGARAKVPAISEIERDVNKSFNEYPHLKKSQGPVLSLLQAYLTMVPDIHYSTGLTLIAGHLLLLAPEEDAFWIFVSVMDTHLRPYFASPAIQLEVDANLFGKAVEVADPTVARKVFVDMAIVPSTICRPWFTRLFVGTLPQQYLDRIWDLFLYEGVPFLLRVGLTLFSCLRRKLLECTSPDAARALLRQPVPALLPPSPDSFVSLALAAKFKDDDFKKQRTKLEGQIKRQTQVPRPTGSISLPRT